MTLAYECLLGLSFPACLMKLCEEMHSTGERLITGESFVDGHVGARQSLPVLVIIWNSPFHLVIPSYYLFFFPLFNSFTWLASYHVFHYVPCTQALKMKCWSLKLFLSPSRYLPILRDESVRFIWQFSKLNILHLRVWYREPRIWVLVWELDLLENQISDSFSWGCWVLLPPCYLRAA